MLHASHRVKNYSLPVWLVAIIFLFLSLVFWLVAFPHAAARSAQLVVGKQRISLEIADTDSVRRKGLGDRASLPQNAGMLFVFPSPDVYSFWMKDMHFPLDIIWISHARIVDMATLPPPTSTSAVIPTHYPKVQADMVLELNAGKAAALGLGLGSSLDIQR